MFYEFDLPIPAGTAASAPAEVEAVMAAGIIRQVSVQIPRGCRSLVHTVAVRGIHQVWPSNPDGSHKGDNPRLAWPEDYDLTEPPHSLTLRGWSPDTSYSHIVTWRFQMVAAPVPEPAPAPKKRGLFSGLRNKGAS